MEVPSRPHVRTLLVLVLLASSSSPAHADKAYDELSFEEKRDLAKKWRPKAKRQSAAAASATSNVGVGVGVDARVTTLSATAASLPRDPRAPHAGVHRPRLVHQHPTLPVGEPLPRLSVEDLDGDDGRFDCHRQRLCPFILTGALQGWPAYTEWPDPKSPRAWQQYLPKRFPTAIADFYPYNMFSSERQVASRLYYTRLSRAVEELAILTGPQQQSRQRQQRGGTGAGAGPSDYPYEPEERITGRYMHLQLSGSDWHQLESRGDLPVPHERHWLTASNDHWMRTCLGYPHSSIATEFHLKTHWKMLLVGQQGAGMMNHTDSLRTASWHALLAGSKWYYLCGETRPVDAAGTSASASAANASGPSRIRTGTRRRQICYEDYLEPGEVLYYGTDWYHETQNLVTPTLTLTDTVVHEHNWEGIADLLHETCVDSSRGPLRWKLSSELCDALQSCYGYWSEVFGEGGGTWGKGTGKGTGTGKGKRRERAGEANEEGHNQKAPARWRHWRGRASPEAIYEREQTEAGLPVSYKEWLEREQLVLY